MRGLKVPIVEVLYEMSAGRAHRHSPDLPLDLAPLRNVVQRPCCYCHAAHWVIRPGLSRSHPRHVAADEEGGAHLAGFFKGFYEREVVGGEEGF